MRGIDFTFALAVGAFLLASWVDARVGGLASEAPAKRMGCVSSGWLACRRRSAGSTSCRRPARHSRNHCPARQMRRKSAACDCRTIFAALTAVMRRGR